MQRPVPSRFGRREFLGATIATALTAAASPTFAASPAAPAPFPETTFSLDGSRVRFYSQAFVEPLKILQISDAHLFLDDERGADFTEYSGRMAKAYNKTRHFRTGAETNPIDAFREIAANAKTQKVDAIVLTGDILSFPSAAGADFVRETLGATGIPYFYVAGNHDWHFEGLPGSSRELRDAWIPRRLTPLYPAPIAQNADSSKIAETLQFPVAGTPLAYSVDFRGVKLLLVDDSTYEILPEQLEFCRRELAQGAPTLLFAHIPLYAPGRSVGFGCGHPNWNASTDGNFEIERRPRWPESGCSETTFAFRREILAAPNVIGGFFGHIHVPSLDICSRKPLYVAPAAVDASVATIELLPAPSDV